jgi:hypothetical protein
MFSTIAFPDVSADHTHAFACTLETDDVGPALGESLAPAIPRPEPAEMDDAA